jgi:hypothetical protein
VKKVLSTILKLSLVVVLTTGFFVWDRFSQNPEQIIPFPYVFNDPAPELKVDAPILLAGDRMGFYLNKFSTTLAETISKDLARPIKIQSIARPGQALHRTLHQLKSLKQWPQILIFQGSSEEFFESKFHSSEIPLIRKNFTIYRNDKVETLLILYPWLSRLIYGPIKRTTLGTTPQMEALSEEDYLKKLETEFLLFEQQLIEVVTLAKDRNSLLILTTTPINLDIPPKSVCSFTTTSDIEAEILRLRKLLMENNPKEAYIKSSKLITQFSGNAQLQYLHGQVAKRLGKVDEAVKTLLSSSAYDCTPWRATEVHNSIIRKVAKEHQVLLFDFAKLVENDFSANTTFFDEIYPQNIYYDRGMQQLGLVIKRILKL